MTDTFVCSVVHIDEQRFPVGCKCGIIHCKTMILRSHESTLSSCQLNGLITTPVSIFEFIGFCTTCERKQLITHTDTEYRFICFHRCADVGNSCFAVSRISGSVGDKQSVIFQRIKIIIPRHPNNGCIPFEQTAYDVMLHSAIHQHHSVFSIAIRNYFRAACFCYLIFIIGIDKRNIFILRKNQFSKHRSFFPN